MAIWDAILGNRTQVYADGTAVKDLLTRFLPVRVYFYINSTDLLAPTNAQLISPVKGEISKLSVIVQSAVTTGGAITVLVGTTTVLGLSVTVADADAAGVILTDTPTGTDATHRVDVGSRIQIAPAAAFATAGAVNGYLEIIPN